MQTLNTKTQRKQAAAWYKHQAAWRKNIRQTHGILVLCAVDMWTDSGGWTTEYQALHYAYNNLGRAFELTPKLQHSAIANWLGKLNAKDFALVLMDDPSHGYRYTAKQRKDPTMRQEIADVTRYKQLIKSAPKGTRNLLALIFDPPPAE